MPYGSSNQGFDVTAGNFGGTVALANKLLTDSFRKTSNGLVFRRNVSYGEKSKYSDGEVQTVPAAVPEPSSMAIVGLGAIGMMGYAWRRRRAIA